MSARRRGERIEPTHEWQGLLPLFTWPEQVEYERIRQPVLFGSPVAERAEETGVSERTLRRRIKRFEREGMDSLFATEKAKRRKLPPGIRRLIVDLKAEYPSFNLNEIANVVRVCFGRKPDVRSVRRVLEEEALPLKLRRSYPLYYEMEDARERRAAVVELRVDGWSAKAIAGYLGVHRVTVHRILRRFEQEGAGGLGEKSRGRPAGVRKVTIAAIEEVRKLARNPELGAFRVHAALKQRGFDLSRATCGRILAQVREIYGYDKPGEASGGGAKKEMPFASERHHEYWSADVRYLDMLDEGLLAEGMVYAITIIENYSRAVLASSVTRRQDLNAFLAVLYRAIQEYGPPEAFVTDSGSIFLASRAQTIYRLLGIRKVEIDKGKPWQSYLETAYNTQRRMADYYFSEAADWNGLYAEEGLAGREVAVWIQEDALTVEYGGQALSRYEVECDPARGAVAVGRLRGVKSHALFEHSIVVAQLKLFDLSEVLGEEGWLRAIRLADYAPRRPRRPELLQQVLFPYTEAV